jgi:hypothetical protein
MKHDDTIISAIEVITFFIAQLTIGTIRPARAGH